MYFHSRTEAGDKLAAELAAYQSQDCIIVALSIGAVEVGSRIATALNCQLALFLTENIELPGEHTTIGTLAQDGSLIYNNRLSAGEIEEYYAEFHGYIDDQRREKLAKINRLLGMGKSGTLEPSNLKDRVIILVSDGLKTGMSLEAAVQFLKPVRVKRLVIVTPIASVPAVDRMHILADELHCLRVTENYISTKHYYDENNLPTREEVLERIKNHM